MSHPTPQRERTPNRLIHEKSPYLLQHAYNPVDWFAWGTEAFEKARREDKPIFLSIGYSTCYWCHVMEREVFENEELAHLLNELFVNIKVDREERPDIDRIYMSALQAMTGGGGWPMSLFLGHDLRPFYGATYIPPRAQYGRPGFADVLRTIHEVWKHDRAQITQVADRMHDLLRQMSALDSAIIEADSRAFDVAYESFLKSFDETNAGFGGAPKFPRPTAYAFLLRYHKRTGKQYALDMVLRTLKTMARSGMYDHLGGGFHRYATDERWHVPHFEKMLYDQAQLVVSYLEAYQLTHDEFYAIVARDILAYVLDRMTDVEGGFYSAEDAESAISWDNPAKKEEGAYYVWKYYEELMEMLEPDEREVFFRTFGVEKDGNVIADPHGVFRGKNILSLCHTSSEVAQQLGLTKEEVESHLASARKKILAARKKRPAPHLDDKVLVSWNSLMISAFARAHQVLGEEEYLKAARRAAEFLLTKLADRTSGQLLRRYRDGEARFEAQLGDFAFFVQALLDLFEASFDPKYLQDAIAFAERTIQLFFDKQQGGFYDTSGNDSTLLVRTKEWYDGAEPSGNAIAILNLLRLSQITGNTEFEAMARKSLTLFGQKMIQAPHAAPQMLIALECSHARPKQIVIAGDANDPRMRLLVKEVHSHFIPYKIVLRNDGNAEFAKLSSFATYLDLMQPLNGTPTVYVCVDYSCKLPANNPEELRSQLLNQI